MINKAQRHSFLSILWTSYIACILIFVFHALFVKKNVHTDLLSLLPKDNFEGVRETQQFFQDSDIAERVVIMIGHEDTHKAKKVLNAIRNKIKEKKIPITEQSHIFGEKYKYFLSDIYPSRFGFLSPKDRELILKNKTTLIARDAFSEINSVFSFISPNQITEDPFFLFNHYARSIIPSSNIQRDADKDLYVRDGKATWYLMNAKLSDSGFSINVQKEVGKELVTFMDQLQTQEDVHIIKTGVVFYAFKGFEQANQEISTISVFSMLAIVGLFLAVFKSTRPLVFCITVIGSGILGGLFICLVLFGKIHIVSLLFGSSLIGMTVDYVIHYSSAAYNWSENKEKSNDQLAVFKSLMPAILLGVLSSSLGYAILCFIPFPGIQEMAMFGASGLLTSFISVYFWGPFIVKSKKNILNSSTQNMCVERKFNFSQKWMSLFIFGLFITSLFKISFDDDIRNFQAPDIQLKKQENEIWRLTRTEKSFQFLVVKASSIDELAVAEERVLEVLNPLQKAGDLIINRSLVQIIPSVQQQIENHKLTKKVHEREWLTFSKLLNLKDSMPDVPYVKPIQFTVERMTALREISKDLVYKKDGQWMGRILLKHVKNSNALKETLKQFNNVTFVDTQKAYQDLFKLYREKTLFLAMLVFFAIFLTLALLKSIKDAYHIVSPVLLAILATIGVMGLSQVVFTIFHVMGLFIILCIGIDYSLFFYWRDEGDLLSFKRGSILMTNCLCAITTLLSFGLLCFSQTKAVHDFGVSIFIGITLCFGMCYMFACQKREK